MSDSRIVFQVSDANPALSKVFLSLMSRSEEDFIGAILFFNPEKSHEWSVEQGVRAKRIADEAAALDIQGKCTKDKQRELLQLCEDCGLSQAFVEKANRKEFDDFKKDLVELLKKYKLNPSDLFIGIGKGKEINLLSLSYIGQLPRPGTATGYGVIFAAEKSE